MYPNWHSESQVGRGSVYPNEKTSNMVDNQRDINSQLIDRCALVEADFSQKPPGVSQAYQSGSVVGNSKLISYLPASSAELLALL